MYGLRVSKPGIDVISSDPKDRIIDSEIPCLKITQSGRQDFSIANSSSSSFTHSITTSLPILVLAYIYNPNTSRYQIATPTSSGDKILFSYEFTSTTLYITVFNSTGSILNSHYYWFVLYA